VIVSPSPDHPLVVEFKSALLKGDPIESKACLDKLQKMAVEMAKRCGMRAFVVIAHHVRLDPLRFGVHFHIVGFGQVDYQARYPGWIIKLQKQFWNYIKRQTSWVKIWNRVVHLIFYLLTHAYVQDGRHTLRYYGLMSYNKLHCEMKTVSEVMRCPECGAPVWECSYDEQDGWYEHRQHLVFTTITTYTVV